MDDPSGGWRVTRVLPANFQLATPFHSRLTVRHMTDRHWSSVHYVSPYGGGGIITKMWVCCNPYARRRLASTTVNLIAVRISGGILQYAMFFSLYVSFHPTLYKTHSSPFLYSVCLSACFVLWHSCMSVIKVWKPAAPVCVQCSLGRAIPSIWEQSVVR